MSALGGLFVVTAAYLSFYNTFFDVQGSVSVPIATGSFNAAGLTVGISQSLLATDGQSVLGSTLFSDQVSGVSLESPNLAGTGSLSSAGFPGSISISLPINQNLTLDLGNNVFLTGTASGTLVMDVVTPEPSTLLLGGGAGVIGRCRATKAREALATGSGTAIPTPARQSRAVAHSPRVTGRWPHGIGIVGGWRCRSRAHVAWADL